jgi:hypothetical protein
VFDLTAPSSNRDTELRLGPRARGVFTTKGWNDALRAAGIAAGNWWIANYLPLRWNRAYAVGQLNYTPRSKSRLAALRRGVPPFYLTGQMRSMAYSRSHTEAVAKKGGARFWIVCPVGHPLQPSTAEDFRTLPAREKTAVAREYRKAIIDALSAQRTIRFNQQAARLQATTLKRNHAKAVRAEQRRITTAQRRQDRRRRSIPHAA